MKKSDYVKQIEDANEELQRKIEEQGKVIDIYQDNLRRVQSELGQNRLVVVCSDEKDAVGGVWGNLNTLVYHVNLIVVPASQEEKQKVRDGYLLKKEILLFKSIKDRYNKQGSIYDMDMLNSYAKGRDVKPYVI